MMGISSCMDMNMVFCQSSAGDNWGMASAHKVVNMVGCSD